MVSGHKLRLQGTKGMDRIYKKKQDKHAQGTSGFHELHFAYEENL